MTTLTITFLMLASSGIDEAKLTLVFESLAACEEAKPILEGRMIFAELGECTPDK